MNADALACDVFTARQMIRSGVREAAARLLAVHLTGFDPDVAAGDPLLVQAAQLYTSVVADPAWVAYLCRHDHRHQPVDAATAPGAGFRLPVEEPTMELPTLVTGAGLDLGHRSWSVSLDQARRQHRQGRCGEAIRTAGQALNAWQRSGSARAGNRGVTLIVGVAAMMSACLRDTDARAVLTENTRHLPPPDSGDRHAFAVYALRVMDATAQPHPHVCLAHTGSAWKTALAATGDDTVPWQHRRDRWWQLLICGPPPSP